jgi:hypothetical protein
MNAKVIGVIAGCILLAGMVIWLRRGNHEPSAQGEPQAEVQATPDRSNPIARRMEETTQQRGADGAERLAPGRIDAGGSVRAAARPTPAAGGGAGDAVAQYADEDEAQFEALKDKALTHADPDERISALTELRAFEDERVAPILITALSDSDRDVRMQALQDLETMTDGPPVDALAPLLNDADAEIRLEVVRTLGDSEDPRAKTLIEGAVNDPDEDVRSAAKEILEIPSEDEE